MSGMLDGCPGCAAIMRELKEAFAEVQISTNRATKEAWANTYRMLGISGSEEDKAPWRNRFRRCALQSCWR
jgi:hypothetical protein